MDGTTTRLEILLNHITISCVPEILQILFLLQNPLALTNYLNYPAKKITYIEKKNNI